MNRRQSPVLPAHFSPPLSNRRAVPPHPWPTGYCFSSPGGHFYYRVIGPCCRLFDREQLPWPCCRIQWRGKEPSWRRIGKRFVPDLASKTHPSYCVEMLNQGKEETLVLTLYPVKLSAAEQEWWYARKTPLTPAQP